MAIFNSYVSLPEGTIVYCNMVYPKMAGSMGEKWWSTIEFVAILFLDKPILGPANQCWVHRRRRNSDVSSGPEAEEAPLSCQWLRKPCGD